MAGGRQLQFDKQQALEQAMCVFWKKGFLGASLADLTSAMGINKPSLYAAFGNKEALFVAAVDHYLTRYASPHLELLKVPGKPLNERLTAYLKSIARLLSDKSKPGGCFLSVASTEIASNNMPEKALDTIIEANSFSENYLKTFLLSEQVQGQLKPDADIEQLALIINTFAHGMAAMARNGLPLEQLEAMVPTVVNLLDIQNKDNQFREIAE